MKPRLVLFTLALFTNVSLSLSLCIFTQCTVNEICQKEEEFEEKKKRIARK